MKRKVGKGLLIVIVFVVLVLSALFDFFRDSEIFLGFLYGAGGVVLFMLLAKLLSLIQREGKQDD